MKKILLFILVALFFCSTWAQNKIIEDPHAIVRKIGNGFHAIEVSNAIDLYLSQGNAESVAVSASDKDDIDHITTVVENGILKIKYDNASWFGWFKGSRKLKAYVSFINIDKISASGASDVHIEGSITADKLEVHLSGASDIKGSLKVNQLNLEQSGASDAVINGSAASLTIDASGASDVKAYDFITENCTARASGASDIKITVNKELNAQASGASDIHYKGTAVIKELHSSGASNVSKKG